MGDNKISEAWPDYLMIRDTGVHDDAGGLGQHIFTTAGAGYEKVKYVRADLAHLHGEAVPVVTYCGRRLTPEGTRECWGVLAEGVEDLPRNAKLYLHPQPAELNEVSGVDVDDLRELFEKHAKGRNLAPDTWGVSSYVDPYVDNDWNEWVAAWKAIASCQPVGAGDKWLFVESPGEFTERLRAALQEFDLLGAVRNVLIENPPTLVSRQAVQSIDLAENLLSVLIEEGVLSRNGRVFQKLRGMIDGRDAGAGVGL